MFFETPRCLMNSESRFPSSHPPHNIKEVASGFLFYSSPVAHISSCHAKHQREASEAVKEKSEFTPPA